jgi:hypothetical protein
MKDKKICIFMITMFIITIYEPQSPLRGYIRKGQNKRAWDSLREGWTRKHSKLPFLLESVSSASFPFALAATKGLSHVTLIRLGVHWRENSDI